VQRTPIIRTWDRNHRASVPIFIARVLKGLGQKAVKVGGFKVPTQDVSGVPGSVRNDTMTVCAHGD
jgi:hypothetical protein